MANRFFGRIQEAMRVSAVPPTSSGQMSPAALLTQIVPSRGFRSAPTRKRAKTASRKASAARPARKRAAAKGRSLVKGSKAAKAWGRKMARMRKR